MPYKNLPQELPLEVLLRIIGYATQESFYDSIGIADEYLREMTIFGSIQMQNVQNVCQTWRDILSFNGNHREYLMMHQRRGRLLCKFNYNR